MSHSVLEVGQIVKQIKDAFRPLECNADIWDYETKIKFKVLHEGRKIFEKIKVNIDDLIASPDALVKYLNAVRQVVQEEMRKIKPNFEFDDPDLVDLKNI